MRITLFGAAGEVTGSAYLVASSRARVLIDCGLFQGAPADERRNRVPRELSPRRLDAVVLTHAHLDHTGRLPLLVRHGYRGPVYATPATIDLAGLLLDDMAHLQESDARRANQRRQRAGAPPVAPLFDDRDVERVLQLCEPLPYERPATVAPGITVRMVESGHVLGSASIQLTATDEGRETTVVFSGDIGPWGAPILKDPGPITAADLVFLESTYGDRDHRSLDDTIAEFTAVVRCAIARRGKILAPAFAVGRSQQILYHLAELFRAGDLPPFPIYLDSPLAIKATELYHNHPELADAEATRMLRGGRFLLDMQTLRTCETVAESQALNHLDGPCMIIAGSGMCTGGRIVHHLKHNLWRPETAVLIVGYQAAGSLGRQLVDGATRVRIYGEQIVVRAAVHSLGGFSAHAGQSELLRWLAPMAGRRPRIYLTHGEDRARASLAQRIAERYQLSAALPCLHDTIEIGG